MLAEHQRQRLLDIALAGTSKGLIHAARKVYAGLLLTKPGFAPALIGQAMSYLVVNDFDEAERLLREEVLAKNPEDVDAKAILSLCLTLSGQNNEAEALLRDVARGEGTGAEMAKAILAAATP